MTDRPDDDPYRSPRWMPEDSSDEVPAPDWQLNGYADLALVFAFVAVPIAAAAGLFIYLDAN